MKRKTYFYNPLTCVVRVVKGGMNIRRVTEEMAKAGFRLTSYTGGKRS